MKIPPPGFGKDPINESLRQIMCREEILEAAVSQRDATIAELRESHERLRKALEEMVANIGECTCHEGFTCRKLRDPECVFHRFDPEVANARAVLAAAPKEPETEKRPGAG